MAAMNTLYRLHLMPRLTAEKQAGKLWPSVAAIALGMTLARWTWIFLAPASMAVLPPTEIAVDEDAGNLFGVASTVAGTGIAVLPGVRLVGVFAPLNNATARTPNNKNGFALLQLDEKHQASAVLGAEVAPGVRLREIYADHVVLERDGINQRVNLETEK
jgi:Type II secretion system protein C